jgi:hypothetical protein
VEDEIDLDDGDFEELESLLDASARHALEVGNGQEFVMWFAENAPGIAPQFATHIPLEQRRGALAMLGRLLWNRIPLPGNRFRPRPLRKPERNAACPCGSGQKFKHCCALVAQAGDPFEDVSMLKFVLQQYPPSQLRDLPLGDMGMDELAFIAREWIDEGRELDAEALLEPLFAEDERLDARVEPAFDALADVYDALDAPEKKDLLLERCLASSDRRLRGAALHRQVCMLADRGEREEAWKLFDVARRLEPDNPMLATLELTLLAAEGDRSRLRRRADFWIERLSRDPEQDHSEQIEFIEQFAEDPDAWALDAAAAQSDVVRALRDLVGTIPAPECHYDIVVEAGEMRLQPRAELVELVREMESVLAKSVSEGGSREERTALSEWLQQNPLAWQMFDMLDVMTHTLVEADLMGAERMLLAPLLEHGLSLLRLILDAHDANDRALAWSCEDNRSALNLVAMLCGLRATAEESVEEAFDLASWMVFTLDPRDHYELRKELLGWYLDDGDAKAALDLCDRFPGDSLPAMAFGRALALFLLDRLPEAESALRFAVQMHGEILPMLAARDPKPPRVGRKLVRPENEAWLYRERFRGHWERSGAIAWARKTMQGRR